MIARSEMELHIKCFSERLEEAGNKFGTTVEGDMFGNTMFREHVHNK